MSINENDINSKNVVAFDFFDTLVHRNYHPEAILLLWAKTYIKRLGLEITPKELYEIRKCSEKKLKEVYEEPTYNMLINDVLSSLKGYQVITDDSGELIDLSYEIETQIEVKNIIFDKNLIERIKEEKAKGKKILIISDFYMPTDFFMKVLNNRGYANLFDKVYISSEYNKRKSTGSLYKYVLCDLKICAEELLMIGDNKKSDYEIPRSLGICAEYRPYVDNNLFYGDSVGRQLKKIFRNTQQENAFSGYIPALLIFIDRLYNEAVKDGCKKLLFCSREGQDLKRLFDIYQNSYVINNYIETEYLYVSRRATLLPSLKSIENEDFNIIFRQYPQIRIDDFLYSIGFSEIECNEILNNTQIKCDVLIKYRDSNFQRLISNEYFVQNFESKRKNQNVLLREYLYSLNNKTLEEVYIVDIGWKGTIQDNIFKALDGGTKVHGYYFGLMNYQDSVGNIKKGLMFQEKEILNCMNLYSYNCIELERVFAANHGQVLFYLKDNQSIIPSLSNCKEDTELYEYVEIWQNNMNINFEKSINIINASFMDINILKKFLENEYLYQLCVISPRQRKIYLSFRKKAKENFGNISGLKIYHDDASLRDKQIKKKYFFVDYSYRLLDKIKLSFLGFVADLYCKVVYVIKKDK